MRTRVFTRRLYTYTASGEIQNGATVCDFFFQYWTRRIAHVKYTRNTLFVQRRGGGDENILFATCTSPHTRTRTDYSHPKERYSAPGEIEKDAPLPPPRHLAFNMALQTCVPRKIFVILLRTQSLDALLIITLPIFYAS